MLFLASAAFAAASLALKQDPLQEDLAEKCRQHATVTYEEAIQHPGIYSDSIPECQKTYQNDNWEQYAYFAAAWRYEISGDENHLQVSHKQCLRPCNTTYLVLTSFKTSVSAP